MANSIRHGNTIPTTPIGIEKGKYKVLAASHQQLAEGDATWRFRSQLPQRGCNLQPAYIPLRFSDVLSSGVYDPVC
jgi:hypothetical protein